MGVGWGGVGMVAGAWEKSQKVIIVGGNYSVFESTYRTNTYIGIGNHRYI